MLCDSGLDSKNKFYVSRLLLMYAVFSIRVGEPLAAASCLNSANAGRGYLRSSLYLAALAEAGRLAEAIQRVHSDVLAVEDARVVQEAVEKLAEKVI